MIVRFTPSGADADRYKDLTPDNVYRVIGWIIDSFRIMNDQGEPYLYSCSAFTVIDPRWPADWITKFGKGGERYVSPAALSEAGFFERVFDGEKEAIRILRQRLQHWEKDEVS